MCENGGNAYIKIHTLVILYGDLERFELGDSEIFFNLTFELLLGHFILCRFIQFSNVTQDDNSN